MKSVLVLLILEFGSISAKPNSSPRHVDPGSGRIVGGIEATPYEFPWIVDLRQGGHSCGGSIYNSEWAVTAAHCLEESPSGYTLTAGDHNISVFGDDHEQKRRVVAVIRHENHGSPIPRENDIAILRVSPPFVFNEWVGPLKVAPKGFPPTERCIVAGWGALSESGGSSSKLMKVDVPVVSDAKCREAYSESAIAESMICSGEVGKDSCQGDSGGPMTCDSENGPVLCGIVSWGTGCAREGYPGVYTEASYFNEWIESSLVFPPDINSSFVEQSEGCGGILDGTSGRISYKFNETYDDQEHCVWTVRVDRSNLRVKLVDGGLRPTDFVSITGVYGDGTSHTTIVRLDEEINVVGPIILVTFRSGVAEEEEDVGLGFSLEFYGTGYFDTSGSIYKHFHYNETSGSISHPLIGNYLPNEFTTIVVNPNNRLNPSLTFTSLSTECNFDYVHVLNRDSDGFTSVGSYCGTNFPEPIVGLDGVLLIVFTSDSSVEQSGFKFNWM